MTQELGLWWNASLKLNERFQYQFQYRHSEQLDGSTVYGFLMFSGFKAMENNVTVRMEKGKAAILWQNNTLPWLSMN